MIEPGFVLLGVTGATSAAFIVAWSAIVIREIGAYIMRSG